jgi:mono/diheme cytochrome c family protein
MANPTMTARLARSLTRGWRLAAAALSIVVSASLAAGLSAPSAALADGGSARLQEPPSPRSSAAQSAGRALLDSYCAGCHNARTKAGALALEEYDLDRIGDNPKVWEAVVRKLRGGMMPPPGAPRPDPRTLAAFVSELEAALDREAALRPNPGHVAVRRLNRTEYGNAIRDLLALEIDPASLLPADDESEGFDNIAGVLKMSPSLLEQYLAASRAISSLAVGDSAETPVRRTFAVRPDLAQDDHIEGLPLGTRGGIVIRHNFPLDAEYDISVVLLRNIVGYVTGLEFAHQLEVTIDGTRVLLAPVGGEEDNRLSDANQALAADRIDARLRTRVAVKAGPRSIGVAFLRRTSAESDEPLQPFTRDLDLQNMNGIPLIDHVVVAGPFHASGPGDTPSRRRIFGCRPADPADEVPCARTILSALARRAYRRPVTTDDIEPLLAFYRTGRERGTTFDAGIELALRFMLTSPNFLFRVEQDPAGTAPGAVRRATGLELASRLSFFLWSSLPDEELLSAAEQGLLSDTAGIDKQARRMLADWRAASLVDNFAEQWLLLRNLENVRPDREEFPNFDDNLRQAFREETRLFVGSVLGEDRSVLDLLTANYTFVNERLAKHYGIPNIYGSHFRRVTLDGEARRGLLGEGSILTVTSYPNRTSPVLRGKWILENILGTPPAPPPPNVPALKEDRHGAAATSVRGRLEAHRSDPACASCHRVMDPLGFALEHFDAVGQWRSREAGHPIDASGELADGTAIDGAVALRRALVERRDQFAGTLSEKLLTYALGRGLDDYDRPAVRSIVRAAAAQDYRFSAIVLGIVESQPFQMTIAK